jgi:hypothetical protein
MKGSERFPRVLVGTPIYDKKDYCRKQFVELVKKLDYPNFFWALVDNTAKPAYFHKLRREHPGHVFRVPRGNNSRDALANASNFLRRKALDEGYEYLLMLESDVFPPVDVIWRLLRHGKAVVGGVYEIGDGASRRPCLFQTVAKLGVMGTELIPPEKWHEYRNRGLKQVHGMGVGCTLIHRSILERFPFWYSSADDERMKGESQRKHPDVYFYLDLHNAGICVYADTDVFCHHENSDWLKVVDV